MNGKYTILLVDDSESDRVSYVRYLQSEQSYCITEAETLEEGLELWRSQQPDIVLLDMNVPDGDGLEFLEAITTDNLINKLPVIMLTGERDERIAVQAMKLGAADYLVKGDVTAVSLLTCIAQVQENNLLFQQLRRSQQQQTVIASMALYIRRSHTFADVSNAIVQEIRNFLDADRTIIYRFNPDMSGTIVAEAVVSPWEPCLNAQVEDTCFRENLGGEYRKGKVFAANDIYEANLTECHIQLLEQFQIRANLVVPVLLNGENKNTLWGLLIVQQCSAPRQWHEEDIQLLHQLSIHLAIALQQAELYQNLESLNSSLEEKVEERTQEIQLQSQMLEQINDAVISTTPDGTILTWNIGSEKLYGYESNEAIGQNISMLYPKEDLPLLQSSVFIPLFKKGTHEVELRIQTKSGNILYISLRLSVVRDAIGNPIRLIGCSNNISDRKRAEQEIQQLNQELETKVLERTQELAQVNSLQRAILKSANYAIISTDLDGIIQTCNPSVERMLGYSVSELIGKVTPEIIHDCQEVIDRAVTLSAELDQDIPVGFEVFVAKSRRDIVSEQEWTYIRKDGSCFPVLLSITALKDDNQQVIGFLGIAQDISDRKQAEESLRESERRFASLAAAAPVAIFRINRDNECIYVNEFWTRITGQESSVALGYGWIETIHPDDREQIHQQWTQAIDQQAPYQGEGRCVKPDGTISFYYCQALPEIDEEGNFIGYIGTLTDISDRKQIETALIESEGKFRRLVEGGNDLIWSTDKNGAFTYLSPQFQTLFGLEVNEWIGKTFTDLVHPEDVDGLISAYLQSIRSQQKASNIEFRHLHQNGDYIWVSINTTPIIDSEGIVIGGQGILADISDRKQAEQQLKKTMDRLSVALKSGAIGCWEWELETNILTWDERIYELYAVPLGTTVLFETWASRVHPDDLQPAQTLLQQAIAGETEFDMEFRAIHPDRSIHFLKSYGLVIRDLQGNAQRMIGVNFDITARKQAEQTIRQQIEKETLLRQITQKIRQSLDLQKIFKTACEEIRQFIQTDRVAIFKFFPESGYDDGEFVAESLNEGFSSVVAIRVQDHCFGQNHAEFYVKGHFHAINDVLNSNLQPCHIEILQQFQIRANFVMPLLRGEELWGLLCIQNCTAPRIWETSEMDLIQQIAGQLAIAIQQADLFDQLQQQLRERQRAQQQLSEGNAQLAISNEQLARATRLKDEFLANMSHELRTPLNAILGMSESLQETDLSQRQENAVKLIEKSGRHLLDLINDILDLSKIEAGKLELEFSAAPVNILCENSTILVKQMAFSKNIQLYTRIDENIRSIWVDERRIRQVLINLLSNAVKFTPSGGQVTLAVELEESEIVFSVTDTGIGITPENLGKLFQPFVQIDSNLSRQYAGTGLGLALVQRIVTGHGGTVSVTSTFGEGSCFAVRLPYSSSSSVMSPILESSEVGPTLTNITHSLSCSMPLILIADDNEGNIQTMEDYLGNKGYPILLAYNGIEAVEMTKIHKPDVILMDIQMPLLDGLQATAQIRSDPAIAHIPIIAITALALAGDEDRCFAAGVNEYLVKPVRFKLLIETIQKLSQNQEAS